MRMVNRAGRSEGSGRSGRRGFATCAAAFMLLATSGLGGCTSYVTPGGPASFSEMGVALTPQTADAVIAERLDRKPSARFPTNVVVVRVQQSGYRSYSDEGVGNGAFSVVTNRDVETEAHFARLGRMPGVSGVAPLSRLMVPDKLSNERDLRAAAAQLHADVVVLYTFDTRFGSETVVPAMGVITLGLFPSEQARVTTTASAVVLDTRTGYVYGLAEATAKEEQGASAWTTRSAIEQSRRRAELAAFEQMLASLERTWGEVVSRHAQTAQSK
jgi:hypothetical protein